MNELILPIDKPVGWTSFDVVAKLRGGLKWKKVGHAGTLDPAATGLLIILCGDSTTRADEFMELGKTYRAVAKLGVVTDSDDLDGEVIAEHDVQWNEWLIESELRSFVGEIAQRPPAVSAIRIGGKRSYKLARAGRAVELPERPVHVHSLDIVEMNKPFVTFEMRCSKGTYVRSIARDLGERLGCGGTLAALRRTAVGPIEVRDAWTLSAALAIPEFRGNRS